MISPSNTEICFLQVPAPQSAHVVEQLRDKPGFAMAAAVYSGVDVIAVVEGSSTEITDAYQILAPENTPNIDSYERFPVDSVLPGASAASREMLLDSSCTAFVRCAIRADEVTVSWATNVLATLPGVTRLFPSSELQEVVLEVIAKDKRTFDEAIMSTIQGQWSVVKSTRTFS